MNTRQFKIKMPSDVDVWVAAEATTNCRSKSAQIVFALRSVMAAGAEIGVNTPAAENENAARQGGAPINHGIGGAEDECSHR